MIKSVIILLFIFLIPNISATCNETQVDINSASIKELDKIIGVGPSIAGNITIFRPFSSLDDLLRVPRIGDKTLDKIKIQGLACVAETDVILKNTTSQIELDNNSIEEITEKITEPIPLTETKENNLNETKKIINLSPISLNAQSIKSENNKEVLKRNLSFYGIIAICAVFGALFLFKNRKRKNEFN